MDLVPYHECFARVKFLRTVALPPPPGFEEDRRRVSFKATFIDSSFHQFDAPPQIIPRRRFFADSAEIARRTVVSSGWAEGSSAGEWIDEFAACFAGKISDLASNLAGDPRNSSDGLILSFVLVVFGGMFTHRFMEERAASAAAVRASEETAARLFPADKAAVRALQEVENIGREDENHCCICLDDFSFYSNALRMPCSHVFHRDCLVEWLETNHVCPLCRYALPIQKEPRF